MSYNDHNISMLISDDSLEGPGGVQGNHVSPSWTLNPVVNVHWEMFNIQKVKSTSHNLYKPQLLWFCCQITTDHRKAAIVYNHQTFTK